MFPVVSAKKLNFLIACGRCRKTDVFPRVFQTSATCDSWIIYANILVLHQNKAYKVVKWKKKFCDKSHMVKYIKPCTNLISSRQIWEQISVPLVVWGVGVGWPKQSMDRKTTLIFCQKLIINTSASFATKVILLEKLLACFSLCVRYDYNKLTSQLTHNFIVWSVTTLKMGKVDRQLKTFKNRSLYDKRCSVKSGQVSQNVNSILRGISQK